MRLKTYPNLERNYSMRTLAREKFYCVIFGLMGRSEQVFGRPSSGLYNVYRDRPIVGKSRSAVQPDYRS